MDMDRYDGFYDAVHAIDEALGGEFTSSTRSWLEMGVHGLGKLAQGLRDGPYRPEAEAIWAAVVLRPAMESILWSDLLKLTERIHRGDRNWSGIERLDEDELAVGFLGDIPYHIVESAKAVLGLHTKQVLEKAPRAWSVKRHRLALQAGLDRAQDMERQLITAGLAFAYGRVAQESWPLDTAITKLDMEAKS